MSDARGFIRVECPTCNNPDVWLRCNACQLSDAFALDPDGVRCTCGASYAQGDCLCGAAVPLPGLRFVPFDQGPLALAQLEIAWGRVALLGLGALAAALAVLWWLVG